MITTGHAHFGMGQRVQRGGGEFSNMEERGI